MVWQKAKTGKSPGYHPYTQRDIEKSWLVFR